MEVSAALREALVAEAVRRGVALEVLLTNLKADALAAAPAGPSPVLPPKRKRGRPPLVLPESEKGTFRDYLAKSGLAPTTQRNYFRHAHRLVRAGGSPGWGPTETPESLAARRAATAEHGTGTGALAAWHYWREYAEWGWGVAVPPIRDQAALYPETLAWAVWTVLDGLTLHNARCLTWGRVNIEQGLAVNHRGSVFYTIGREAKHRVVPPQLRRAFQILQDHFRPSSNMELVLPADWDKGGHLNTPMTREEAKSLRAWAEKHQHRPSPAPRTGLPTLPDVEPALDELDGDLVGRAFVRTDPWRPTWRAPRPRRERQEYPLRERPEYPSRERQEHLPQVLPNGGLSNPKVWLPSEEFRHFLRIWGEDRSTWQPWAREKVEQWTADGTDYLSDDPVAESTS